MAQSSGDMERLLPLLEMAYQADQLKMAKILARIRDLRAQLDALERPQTLPSEDITAATLVGADLLWERWVHDRKVLINQELALALRDREMAKDGLTKALSKREAAKQVQKRVSIGVRQTQERRSSW
ncbi:hypothetical protein L0664_11055 [Octadecabacter sp. G9-8]|uniref:Flagellar export protein FliJ n=1 Tax=Octadecabacter dasysiphoniae TaxID=2909341 RepID=A0ABS9CWS8_9RHOB|nr:hypothetical protein [Octadecabacter dasysiphoniae]MCF2871603.1 hypothetical protein [Octadecabacter dasysiphoniae]